MIIPNPQLPSVLCRVLTRHEESSFGSFCKSLESHCWLDEVLKATVDTAAGVPLDRERRPLNPG
ncbi:hypothetical protein K443DRAFT_684934, partial [Laccaria amethystina LaAM-08-1]